MKKENKTMTAKEAVQDILNKTNPDATYEDIMHQIFVRQKIERGLAGIATGNLANPEEVEVVLGKWECEYNGPVLRWLM